MPEQLLAPEPADPEHDEREQEAGPEEAIDMTAPRALRKPRTDVAALDLSTDRLRRLQDGFGKVGDDFRFRADRCVGWDDATGAVRPVGQQVHRPQEPGPHRGRGAGH
ncbi:hypothetical protein HZZ00_18125 [Streptomyces sp. NEAU-sy36]|nr:hypothetical protein HZZ00_18125 [Streptomyces sp. NEAU-sy36]